MHLPNLPVFRPQIDAEAVWRELRPVIESGWLGMGPKVEELERKVAHLVKAKHFVALNSCTSALHLAVKCLDLPKGAHVLTTPISFVSTNAALLWEDLVPVFGNVNRDGQLNESDGAYGTVATIRVHLGGAECLGGPALGNIPVIEDCAHAFGAAWIGQQKCVMRCWSFHAVKNLPMGDGGGISTNDDEIAERLRRLRWMGISKSTHQRSQGRYVSDYSIEELGFKYHMNDITAAIGLAVLPCVKAQNARRQDIAQRYHEAFRSESPSYLPAESSCHFYPLFFDHRERIEERLAAHGIGFSRHYQPNCLYGDFRGYPAPGYLSAMQYWRKVIVLPIFPSMTDQEVERVIEVVRG